MSNEKKRIEGGAEIRFDFEIRRLWKLIQEADQIISSIVYALHEEISVEQYSEEKAIRWLERSSIVSPALKAIVYPPERCDHRDIELTRIFDAKIGEFKNQKLCLDCGELLT